MTRMHSSLQETWRQTAACAEYVDGPPAHPCGRPAIVRMVRKSRRPQFDSRSESVCGTHARVLERLGWKRPRG